MTNILRINGEDVQLTGNQGGTSKNVVDITNVFIKLNPNLDDSAVWTNFFQNGIDATYEELGFSNKEDFIKNLPNFIFIYDYARLVPEIQNVVNHYYASLAKLIFFVNNEFNRNEMINNNEAASELENMDSILGEPATGLIAYYLSGRDFNNNTELECSLLYGDTKIKSVPNG